MLKRLKISRRLSPTLIKNKRSKRLPSIELETTSMTSSSQRSTSQKLKKRIEMKCKNLQIPEPSKLTWKRSTRKRKRRRNSLKREKTGLIPSPRTQLSNKLRSLKNWLLRENSKLFRKLKKLRRLERLPLKLNKQLLRQVIRIDPIHLLIVANSGLPTCQKTTSMATFKPRLMS